MKSTLLGAIPAGLALTLSDSICAVSAWWLAFRFFNVVSFDYNFWRGDVYTLFRQPGYLERFAFEGRCS